MVEVVNLIYLLPSKYFVSCAVIVWILYLLCSFCFPAVHDAFDPSLMKKTAKLTTRATTTPVATTAVIESFTKISAYKYQKCLESSTSFVHDLECLKMSLGNCYTDGSTLFEKLTF